MRRRLGQWSLDSRFHPSPKPGVGEGRVGLGDGPLYQKDTKDHGDEGNDSQHASQVGHNPVQKGGGPMVEKNTVQAHEDHPSKEGHTSSDVV